jgi:hypothetical protein
MQVHAAVVTLSLLRPRMQLSRTRAQWSLSHLKALRQPSGKYRSASGHLRSLIAENNEALLSQPDRRPEGFPLTVLQQLVMAFTAVIFLGAVPDSLRRVYQNLAPGSLR